MIYRFHTFSVRFVKPQRAGKTRRDFAVELFKQVINGNLFTNQLNKTLSTSNATIADLAFPKTCPYNIEAIAKKVENAMMLKGIEPGNSFWSDKELSTEP